MITEHDAKAFSKVRPIDLVAHSLNPSKAKKMKNSYRRSLGVTDVQLSQMDASKQEEAEHDADSVRKYMEKMNLDSFLDAYGSKLYDLQCLSKLINAYLKKSPVINEQEVRQKVSISE